MSARRSSSPTGERVIHYASAVRRHESGRIRSAQLRCRAIAYAAYDLEVTRDWDEVTCRNCLRDHARDLRVIERVAGLQRPSEGSTDPHSAPNAAAQAE